MRTDLPVRPAPRRGVYEAPFWDHVGRGALHLQRCSDCAHHWYPPGPACPTCLSSRWTWTAVSGRGELLSWVTFHRQYFPTVPVPHTVAAVALTEGPILLADVDDGAGGLRVGAPMRLTYRTVRDEAGSVFVLYGWTLERSGPDPQETRDHAHRTS